MFARATAAGAAGRMLTTKAPAKMQAIEIQGLVFRRRICRQRPASRGGRALKHLRVISVNFVTPRFSVASAISVGDNLAPRQRRPWCERHHRGTTMRFVTFLIVIVIPLYLITRRRRKPGA